jgi:replicative DNA helicase
MARPQSSAAITPARAEAADSQLQALRVPPHSVEAEQSLLGGLLLDNEAFDRVADVVTAEDFYRDDHRRIFRHLARLVEAGKPADLVTVSESIEASEDKDKTGGPAYLAALAQNSPSALNARRYAELVRERALQRRLAQVATEIAESALGPSGKEVRQLLDEAESRILEVGEAGGRGTRGFEEIQPVLARVFERIDHLYHQENKSDVTGIPTGFLDLDEKTAGLQPQDLIIVAGRPSMGKTALALNIAEHVAVDNGLPVAIFSMEMSGTQLAMRMLGSIAKVDQHKMRTGRLADEEWGRLSAAMGRLHEAPIYIDETGALNVLELRARARRMRRQSGRLGLIVVDYLQLMRASSSGENRATEISEISRSLKALAKELEVPVVALSQLSRAVEARNDRRPMMSDLRECVTGDTLVCLADGRRMPIRDLVGTCPEVVAISEERRLVHARADKVWPVGKRPVMCVHLASGRRIHATSDHRLYGAGGWRRVRELEVGDRLALARYLPEPEAPIRWPDAWLVLLGHMVGDGSYLKNAPLRYTTGSEENSKAVRDAAAAFGVTVSRHAGRGNWHQLVLSGNGDRWHPKGVNRWLRDLGIFDQRSHEKRLPCDVFRLGNGQVALLLRHLWATDGSIVARPRDQRGSSRVYFSTASRGLAEDVASLLLRFGIVARIRSVVQPGGYRPVHTVDVSGSDQQKLFLESIGTFGPRVPQATALLARLEDSEPNPNVDTLPLEVFAQVKASMRAHGISERRMASLRGTSYGGTSHFAFAPSRGTLQDYAEILGDDKLRAWCMDDVFWDRVVAIEPAGEAEVYDLTVPGPASWLADGIASHNSGAIEQDADVILFIYRDEVYFPDKPETKGRAEVIIGKQRNGPIGRIELAFLGQYTRFENLAHQGTY